MPRIETDDGVMIHYLIDGSPARPPLVLSNSLGSNLTMWDREVDTLADHFCVVRYDTRGHGHSDAPAGEYSIERLALDVLNILDALEIHRTDWCGLSMGGMIGMWIASRHPERIGRMALCNTAAHMASRDLWQGRIETALGEGMAALAEPTLERWFTPAFRADPSNRPVLEKVRGMILGTPPAGYAGCCAAIRDMDQREALASISAECLVPTGP